jgi:hypothetical protein
MIQTTLGSLTLHCSPDVTGFYSSSGTQARRVTAIADANVTELLKMVQLRICGT